MSTCIQITTNPNRFAHFWFAILMIMNLIFTLYNLAPNGTFFRFFKDSLPAVIPSPFNSKVINRPNNKFIGISIGRDCLTQPESRGNTLDFQAFFFNNDPKELTGG